MVKPLAIGYQLRWSSSDSSNETINKVVINQINNQSLVAQQINKEELPEIEILHKPPEWKYVERLFRKPIIPTPVTKEEYPSGWKPPIDDKQNAKYYIKRTKNHMIPVYLKLGFRGQSSLTNIRYIQGDIYTLVNELRIYLEKYTSRKMAIRINEFSGQIYIKGDYVTLVKDYLENKGY